MTAGADDALRDLALRLMDPYPADTSPRRPQLLVGQVPPDLPVELPMPGTSRLVGSLMDRRGVVTIVLDSDLLPDEVYAFYHQQLPAAGWTELVIQPRRHGGFSAPGHLPREPRAEVGYCRGARGPALSLRADAVAGYPTDVRLSLNTDPQHTPCAAPRTEEGAVQLLPDLVAPATAHLRPQGGGFGGNKASSRATLETDDDLATVAAHYTRQLGQAGWTCRGEDQESLLAWSNWTYDEAGQATRQGVLSLSILRQPEVRWQNGSPTLAQRPEVVWQYVLEMRVEWHAQS